jgi:hypothetical protein
MLSIFWMTFSMRSISASESLPVVLSHDIPSSNQEIGELDVDVAIVPVVAIVHVASVPVVNEPEISCKEFCSPLGNNPEGSTSQLTVVHVVGVEIVFLDEREHPVVSRSKIPPAMISIFFFMLFVYRKIKDISNVSFLCAKSNNFAGILTYRHSGVTACSRNLFHYGVMRY